MTTNPIYDEAPLFNRITLTSISSDENEDWLHPVLEIFRPITEPLLLKKNRLYCLPTYFDDEFDPDFAPEPTSALDLPDLELWCASFARNILEILAGKRQASQLTKQFHHRVFGQLEKKAGSEKEVGKIRKIHISEPLDGICETTVTVRFGGRLRALVFRFEGVDKRWLCTALTLL
ncbi:unannotated protein [freshwater metagenome]|uniref:Unannotated protein n=1 Tax=freshwater metagenome TaxID=449393 RepID=A0A6J7IA33_9ZZZZ|nr:hypothetical protein [Actinomycetota bacterium]